MKELFSRLADSLTENICNALIEMMGIGIVLSLAIWAIFTWIGSLMGFTVDFLWPMLIGFAVWTILLFGRKNAIWDKYIFFVNANHGVVIGNRFKKDVVTLTSQTSDTQKITSMRECGPGTHGKGWLSEYPVAYYDTRKKLLIGHTIRVLDTNNIPWFITYQGYLTPLYGALVNLARKGEGVAQDFFQGFFDQAIAREIRSKDGFEQLKDYTAFGQWFENLLAGPKQTHPLEVEYGMFTNTPQIMEMVVDPKIGEAAEQAAKAKQNKAAMDEYIAMGINPKDALDVVLAQEGDADLIIYHLPEHTKGIQTLILGQAPTKGGK